MNHAAALGKSDDVIVIESDFDESPEKVWQALTTPEIMSEWLTSNDAFRTDRAAKPTFREDHEAHHEPPIECEVLIAQSPRLLQCRWRENAGVHMHERCEVESIVTFELTRTQNGGTHLRVVQGDFALVSREPTALAVHAPRQILRSTRAHNLRRMRRRETRGRVIAQAA